MSGKVKLLLAVVFVIILSFAVKKVNDRRIENKIKRIADNYINELKNVNFKEDEFDIKTTIKLVVDFEDIDRILDYGIKKGLVSKDIFTDSDKDKVRKVFGETITVAADSGILIENGEIYLEIKATVSRMELADLEIAIKDDRITGKTIMYDGRVWEWNYILELEEKEKISLLNDRLHEYISEIKILSIENDDDNNVKDVIYAVENAFISEKNDIVEGGLYNNDKNIRIYRIFAENENLRDKKIEIYNENLINGENNASSGNELAINLYALMNSKSEEIEAVLFPDLYCLHTLTGTVIIGNIAIILPDYLKEFKNPNTEININNYKEGDHRWIIRESIQKKK